WTFEQDQESFNSNPVPPDSRIELIINCGAPQMVTLSNGAKVELPNAFLNKLRTGPLPLSISGACQLVAVRLYPWAIPDLIGASTHSGISQIIILGKPWQDFARMIASTIQRRGYQEGIDCLQQYVIDARRPRREFSAVRTAGELLRAAWGQVSM